MLHFFLFCALVSATSAFLVTPSSSLVTPGCLFASPPPTTRPGLSSISSIDDLRKLALSTDYSALANSVQSNLAAESGSDRGGTFVVAQFGILALVLVAPWFGSTVPVFAGLSLLLGSAFLIASGALTLGDSLTPFPKPVPLNALRRDGAFGIVRHPIYAGLLLGCFGFSTLTGSSGRFVFSFLLAFVLSEKVKKEEEFLLEKHGDEYLAYAKEVPGTLFPVLFDTTSQVVPSDVVPPSDPVAKALLGRRTVNDFLPDLPPGWEGALDRAITAATFAPNHKRTEPWRFHLLKLSASRKVCELNAEIVAAEKGEAAGEKKLARWLAMPGWLVVTCVGTGSGLDDPTSTAREDYAAVCCATHNICLSLHAEGIGTKWTTGGVNFDTRFKGAVGIPEGEFVVGTIWFGSAAKATPTPKKRLALDEVLTTHN